MTQNDFLKNYAKNTAGGTQTPASDTAKKPASSTHQTPAPQTPTPAPVQSTPVPQDAQPVSESQTGGVTFYEQKSGFHPPQPSPSTVPVSNTPPTKKKPLLYGAAGAVILIAAIVLISVFGGKITVPDFSTYSISDVQLWCSQNGVNLQKNDVYSETIPEKKIIFQSVSAGEKIKKGDFLSVDVSLGVDLSVEVTLPDFTSMTKNEVEAWATENKMTKVRITTETSETVATGKVIRYEINDSTVIGNVVKRDTPVYVIVSKGSEASADVTVPNFKTMSVADIHAFGREKNVIVTIKEVYDEYIMAGAVISQSVAADKKVAAGSEIVVTVSKGKLITVPSFAGLTREAAQAKASALGIIISIRDVYSDVPEKGFVAQSVPQGKAYEDGTIIELQYSIGNQIKIGSFIGQPEYEVTDWINEQNENGANLSVVFTYTQSETELGTVISQSRKNTRLSIGTVINVVVSKGMPVFVPNFVASQGLSYGSIYTREKVIEICSALNLTPIFVEGACEGRLPGEIFSQSIRPGTEIAEGTTIILQYVPVDKTVRVPDLKGSTRVQANRYNRQLEIEYVELDEYVEGYADKIYRQSLPSDSIVAYGTKITLYVGPLKPAEPDPVLDSALLP